MGNNNNKELEKYANNIDSNILKNIIPFYDEACNTWPNHILRDGCIRALEEEKNIKKEDRKFFYNKLPYLIVNDPDFKRIINKRWKN